MPWLILVTGLPAAGKTTLATWLGQQLGIPVINKDTIKEILFDGLSWSDRAWSMKLGAASIEIMYSVARSTLAAGQSIILDTPLRPDLASPEISALLRQTHSCGIQVICRTNPEVAYRRFKQRAEAGLRHPGHLDMQILRGPRVPMEDRPLRLEVDSEVIEVDMNDFSTVSYEAILAQVGAILGDASTDNLHSQGDESHDSSDGNVILGASV